MCYNSVISGVCVFVIFFILRTDVMHIIEIICVVYLALMLITSIRVFGIICVKCGKNLLNLLGFDWDKRKFKKQNVCVDPCYECSSLLCQSAICAHHSVFFIKFSMWVMHATHRMQMMVFIRIFFWLTFSKVS